MLKLLWTNRAARRSYFGEKAEIVAMTFSDSGSTASGSSLSGAGHLSPQSLSSAVTSKSCPCAKDLWDEADGLTPCVEDITQYLSMRAAASLMSQGF